MCMYHHVIISLFSPFLDAHDCHYIRWRHAFTTDFTGGLVEVNIFFIIFDYLISSIICNELDADSFSVVDFYGRRIERIFPSLIVILVTRSEISAAFPNFIKNKNKYIISLFKLIG